jgi:hypothetical protein
MYPPVNYYMLILQKPLPPKKKKGREKSWSRKQGKGYQFFFFFSFWLLEMEPRALHTLNALPLSYIHNPLTNSFFWGLDELSIGTDKG